MDYQGQNAVDPNMGPMGPNVVTPEQNGPDLSYMPEAQHDVRGMGTIGSSAANSEVAQLMNNDLMGPESAPDLEISDLERPPLSPADMPEVSNSEQMDTALKEAEAARNLAAADVMRGNTISAKMAGRVEDIHDMVKEAGPAAANDAAAKANNEVVLAMRGRGIGEK